MLRALLKQRMQHCSASAALYAAQFYLMSQHMGMSAWVFAFAFLFYFIKSKQTEVG